MCQIHPKYQNILYNLKFIKLFNLLNIQISNNLLLNSTFIRKKKLSTFSYHVNKLETTYHVVFTHWTLNGDVFLNSYT